MQPCEMPHQLLKRLAWTLLLCLCIVVWVLLAAAEQDRPIFVTILADMPHQFQPDPSRASCAHPGIRHSDAFLSLQIHGR